ncbi:hypothetical protein M3Y97_00498900 [Aphelenchoides bicaudatus]|nr:hypothetical protein M3Y97_00498900 [Aphelenchoides bicaudatus]
MLSDNNSILSEKEQSELQLSEFIRHLVHESKYGREEAYFTSTTRPKQWKIVHQMISEIERRKKSIEDEVADLGENLDLPAYIQIVQDYIQMYSPANERKRNLIAIISLLAFCRIYARHLKERAQKEAANDQYTHKNLGRLATYTKCVIQELLQNGLQITWNDFCKELDAYQINEKSFATLPDPRLLLFTASICGCILGACWFIYRSNISAKP